MAEILLPLLIGGAAGMAVGQMAFGGGAPAPPPPPALPELPPPPSLAEAGQAGEAERRRVRRRKGRRETFLTGELAPVTEKKQLLG